MNSPLQPFSFIPSSPNSWSSFKRYQFSFTYMCTHFFAAYSTSYPLFPNASSFPLVQPFPLSRTCSVLLFFDFEEGKREKRK
jgi:hypothetical protein